MNSSGVNGSGTQNKNYASEKKNLRNKFLKTFNITVENINKNLESIVNRHKK